MIKTSLSILALSLTLLCGPANAAESMPHEEFAAQFSPLVGGAEHADLILSLCDKALGETGDAHYRSTANAYKSHAYWLKHDFANAETSAREAIKDNQNSALAHFMLTDALYALQRFDDARTSCLEASRNVPNPAHQTELRSLCESSYEARKAASDPNNLTAPESPENTQAAAPATSPGTAPGK